MVDSVGFPTNQVLSIELARQAIRAEQQSVGNITPHADGGGGGLPRAHTRALPSQTNHNSGLKGERPTRTDVPRGHYLDIRA